MAQEADTANLKDPAGTACTFIPLVSLERERGPSFDLFAKQLPMCLLSVSRAELPLHRMLRILHLVVLRASLGGGGDRLGGGRQSQRPRDLSARLFLVSGRRRRRRRDIALRLPRFPFPFGGTRGRRFGRELVRNVFDPGDRCACRDQVGEFGKRRWVRRLVLLLRGRV